MKRKSDNFIMGLGLTATLGMLGLFIAAVVGWIMNIITIFHMASLTISGELLIRIIGIFIAPIGAILGYF